MKSRLSRQLTSASFAIMAQTARQSVGLFNAIKRSSVRTALTSDSKNPMLIETIARGYSWFEEIASGRAATVRDIAKREGVDEGDVSRMMSFAFLAPDIVKAIIDGRQPLELTAERLKRSGSLPLPWPDQRRLLGFLA